MNHLNDQDVEGSLRRYRPAGPPPELREAVVSQRPSATPWAAVAAALLAAVVLLKVSMAQEVSRLPVEAVDVEREAIEQLTEALGGDVDARRAALILAQQDAVRRANAGTSQEESAR